MKYYHIDAIEVSTIKAALLYAAEQVQASDIPVFEAYEKNEQGKVLFDEEMFQANKDKAALALKLAADIDKLDAEGYNWTAYNDDVSVLDVVAYHGDIEVYACADGSCWYVNGEDEITNLATGELLFVTKVETDAEGNVTKLHCK